MSQGIESQASVKQWAAGAGFDHDPAEVREDKLRILADFCTKVDKQPDELEWCAQTGVRFEHNKPVRGGCQNVPSAQTDPDLPAGQRRIRWKYRIQEQSLFPERQ